MTRPRFFFGGGKLLFRSLATACRHALAGFRSERPASARPSLEGLEERCVPSTDVVATLFDLLGGPANEVEVLDGRTMKVIVKEARLSAGR
jgi:hypothetical protein